MTIFKPILFNAIKPGSIVQFNYSFSKHDPMPLVLFSKYWERGNILAGINLHYMTLRYARLLTSRYCNPSFSYQSIKADKFITNGFRSYKKLGVKNLQIVDCKYLSQILSKIKSYNPNEIEAAREYIQEQLNKQKQKTAQDYIEDDLNRILPPR